MTTNLEGAIGDYGADGWVHWMTCDLGNSYLPALHCGAFELVVGKGKNWGAPHENAGVLMLAIYEDTDEDGMPQNEDEIAFPWSMAGFLGAVAHALESAEYADVEHPAPHNVLDAARELWFALLQKGEPWMSETSS